jgi:hypothetical protein
MNSRPRPISNVSNAGLGAQRFVPPLGLDEAKVIAGAQEGVRRFPVIVTESEKEALSERTILRTKHARDSIVPPSCERVLSWI